MISGVVTTNREAVIRLIVSGPQGQTQEVDAAIDTGFDGFFDIAADTYRSLGVCLVVSPIRDTCRWERQCVRRVRCYSIMG